MSDQTTTKIEQSEIEKHFDQEEMVLFEQAFNAIDAANNFDDGREAVVKLYSALESLYDGGSLMKDGVKLPRYVLYRIILGIKSVTEQWITNENPDKEKSAPAVLTQVWTILKEFEVNKTLPANIYDIVAENHALKEQLKEMRKEK